MPKKTSGFTLIEILIVLVILGALAGLALPSYFGAVEQARANEARVNLQTIYAAQKVYALNHAGVFWNGGSNVAAPGIDVATINTSLSTDITKQYYDITSVTSANTAVATRNTTGGATAGSKVYTIDANGNITP